MVSDFVVSASIDGSSFVVSAPVRDEVVAFAMSAVG